MMKTQVETKVTSSHCRHKTDRIFHRKRNSSLEGLFETCDRFTWSLVTSSSQDCKAGEMHIGSEVSEGKLKLRAQTVDSIDWRDDPLSIKTIVCSRTVDFELCDTEYYSSSLYGRNTELDTQAITSLCGSSNSIAKLCPGFSLRHRPDSKDVKLDTFLAYCLK